MLTRRDREIVRWIGCHGAVQAEHVMTRFAVGRTVAHRRLHELVEFGLVRRHRLLYNDAALLTATPDGLRWADLDRLTPARVSLALLPHTIACAALAAALEPRLITDQTLLSDREHRAAERAAARPLASAITGSDRTACTGRISYYAPPPIASAVKRAARATGADELLELAALPRTATPTIWGRR